MAGDYRAQLNAALLGLEQTHLAKQSYEAGRHLIVHTCQAAGSTGYLRDIMARLSDCNRTARKLRYRLATVLVQTAGRGPQALQLLAAAARLAISCIPLESQAADVDELAMLVRAIAAAAVDMLPAQQSAESGNSFLSRAVLEPLLSAIARAPSQETASSGHVLLGSALEAVTDAPSGAAMHSEALLATLQHQLLGLNSGSPRMQVAQAYVPARQCVQGLGSLVPAAAAKAYIKACLQGIRNKEQWIMRREPLDALAVLADALQVPQRGERAVTAAATADLPPGTAAVLAALPRLLEELERLRYDKIQHVRLACERARTRLQRLAACCHRSDLAAMPAPECPSTGTPLTRPRSAPRKLMAGLAATRTPLQAVGNAPASGDRGKAPSGGSWQQASRKTPLKLDFGIQVFAPPPPTTPDLAALPATQISSTPADSGSATAERPAAECKPRGQQEAVVAVPRSSFGEAPTSPILAEPAAVQEIAVTVASAAQSVIGSMPEAGGPELSASGERAAPQGQLSAGGAAEPAALSAAAAAAVASAEPAATASAEAALAAHQSPTPATAQPVSCGPDVDANAGPLRICMTAEPASVEVTADAASSGRLQQDLQKMRVWVRGAVAPAEFGIEIMSSSSSRPGVFTLHRYVCKDGLLSREVVDRLCAVPDAPTAATVVALSAPPTLQPLEAAAQRQQVEDSSASAAGSALPWREPVAWELPFE